MKDIKVNAASSFNNPSLYSCRAIIRFIPPCAKNSCLSDESRPTRHRTTTIARAWSESSSSLARMNSIAWEKQPSLTKFRRASAWARVRLKRGVYAFVSGRDSKVQVTRWQASWNNYATRCLRRLNSKICLTRRKTLLLVPWGSNQRLSGSTSDIV